MLNKRLKSVLLNLFFSVKTEFLLYFKFNRKSVSIPSCLSRHHISLHGTVSRNHIFYNTCKHMSDMRLSVSRRRSVIKCIGFAVLMTVYTFLKNVIFSPELFNFFFTLDKIHVCRYFVVNHHLTSIKFSFSNIKIKPVTTKPPSRIGRRSKIRYTTYFIIHPKRYAFLLTAENRRDLRSEKCSQSATRE